MESAVVWEEGGNCFIPLPYKERLSVWGFEYI